MTIFEKIAFNWRHLSRQNDPVRSMVAYALAKTGLSSLVRYRRNDSVIRLRSAGLSRILWADPAFVLDGELFLSKVLRLGDTFIDVGANIGILTLLASRLVGDSGGVVAIEAHPRTYILLLDNLKMNGVTNVKAVNLAVGQESGTLRFSDRLDDDWNKVEGNKGTLVVESRRLDEACEGCVHIDVLKIDVEGFELPVLRGATQVLARTDCVVLECWSEHTRSFGYTPGDLLRFMKDLMFLGYQLDESEGGIALSPLNDEPCSANLENWVFVRDPGWLSGRFPKGVNPCR